MSCAKCNSINNKNNLTKYYNMSDPNNDPTNDPIDPTNYNPANPKKKHAAGFLSYFTVNNAEKEFKTELPEMVRVFVTSAGIAYYLCDEFATAMERASILAVGQYLGGYIADALANSNYFKYSKYVMSYGPVLSKFFVATGVYIGGNKAFLDSQQPLSDLFGESATASVVAHYGAPFLRRADNYFAGEAENAYENYL